MATKKKSTKKVTAKKSTKKATAKKPARKTAAKKKTTSEIKAVENPELFAVYEVKAPDGTPVQQRFRQEKAPVAVVFAKRRDNGEWFAVAWTSQESIARTRLNGVTARHIDKKNPKFVAHQFTEAQIVTAVRIVSVQELGGDRPMVEKPQSSAWRRSAKSA